MSAKIMLNTMHDLIFHIHSFHAGEDRVGTSLGYRVEREIFPRQLLCFF